MKHQFVCGQNFERSPYELFMIFNSHLEKYFFINIGLYMYKRKMLLTENKTNKNQIFNQKLSHHKFFYIFT